MIHEVRIYDGQGNLKDVVQPVFDYETKAIGNVTKKECPECKKTTKLKGNQKFCTPDCAKANKTRKERARREERKRLEEAKPVVPCHLCGQPVTGGRRKYCGEICDQKARKIKAMNKQRKTQEIIKLKRAEWKNEQTQTANTGEERGIFATEN